MGFFFGYSYRFACTSGNSMRRRSKISLTKHFCFNLSLFLPGFGKAGALIATKFCRTTNYYCTVSRRLFLHRARDYINIEVHLQIFDFHKI